MVETRLILMISFINFYFIYGIKDGDFDKRQCVMIEKAKQLK